MDIYNLYSMTLTLNHGIENRGYTIYIRLIITLYFLKRS